MRGIIKKPMLGDECMSDGTNLSDRNNVLKLLFNEGSGGQVFDLSGNGNKGILTGTAPGWSSGKYGSAVLLPGSNEYISVANSSSIQTFNALTVIIFYKSADTANVGFFDKGYKDLYLMRESDTTVRFYYEQLTGNDIRVIVGEVCDGLPHMLVAWWDGAHSKIWFDGVDKVGEVTTGTIDTGSDILRVGAIGPTGSYGNIIIDLFLFYNRALSASEIALLCREPFTDLGPRRLVYAPVAGGISMPLVMQQMNHFNGGMAA